MQVLNKEAIYKLNSIYTPITTILDPEDLHISDKYNLSCFSVFNHRLNNEEAEQQILFYQQALEHGDTPNTKQYYKYHDRLLKFYLDLYNRTTVYGAFGKFSKRYSNLVEFDNIKEYKSNVLASIREQFFMGIALPEFASIISGNFDLVHLLYTLKNRPDGKTKISAIIKEHELFLIS